MSRKETPDLMGDLLSGKKASKTARQEDSQPAELEASKPTEGLRIKRTFYLSERGLASLEELQYQLKKMASPEDQGSISLSSIVEQALLQALEELEAKGQESSLARALAG